MTQSLRSFPVMVGLVLGLVLLSCEGAPTPPQNSSQVSQDATSDGPVMNIQRGAGASIASVVNANSGITYQVKATNARLNRKVEGSPVYSVQGVPGGPVHSFVWDGDGSTPVQNAVAHLTIDPVDNSGKIMVKWKDRNGSWLYTQEKFAAPPHPSGGTLVGSTGNFVTESGDPVRTNVFLHGNTTAGEPVLPTIFNHLATWGPGEVRLNGKVFENPFDGPAPLWVGHTMTTVGARNNNGEVKTIGGGIYNPANATNNGVTDPDDLEFHLVFHDLPANVEHPEVIGQGHFPPPVSFFYHLTFEEVSVQVRHSE